MRGAVLTAAGLVLLLALPGYRPPILRCLNQVRALPERLTRSLEEVRAETVPHAAFLAAARDASFPDAVILVTDHPDDAPLNSVFFCAYVLYPRVVIQPRTLDLHPDVVPDYALWTPHFSPGAPDSLRGRPGLVALSERARAYQRGLR